MSVVAAFLGKRPEQMASVIKHDGLPVINSPCETKTVPKCSLVGLHRWLSGRSQNRALTLDELEIELDRVCAELSRRKAEKRKPREEAKAAA